MCRMKQLYLSSSSTAANSLQQLLTTNCIESIVNEQECTSDSKSTHDSGICFEVLVHDSDCDAAKELLAHFLSNSTETAPSAQDTVDDVRHAEIESDALPTKRSSRLWLELLIILALTQPFYSPAHLLLTALFGTETHATFAIYWRHRCLYYGLIIGAELALIWWSGEPWSAFGIVKPNWSVDAISGCLTLFSDIMTNEIGRDILVGIFADLHIPNLPRVRPRADFLLDHPEGVLGVLALLIFTLAIGFSEELMSRGIVLTRLERLTKSRLAAIVLSAAQFAAFHWYWGNLTVGCTFLSGIVYGIAFRWTRSLWPVVFSHTIVDLGWYLYRFS